MPALAPGGQYSGMARGGSPYVGALLLAACTSSAPQWQKPGATPEAVAADLQACRASAPIEPRVPPGPRTKPGVGGGFDGAFERKADQMRQDDRYVAECMRKRGYDDAK